MRQIILDTETTGLNAATGDRVIEIGCVEMVNRRLTGRTLHFYINPQREIDAGAIAVHGITNEFLADKPVFSAVANDIRDFVQDAEAIIHNAPFDLGFLDMEFKLLGLPPFREHLGGVIDTLYEARQMFPGKRNSLDALCDRLGVSNSHRTLHGALLDAEILAEVYLAMTRGQNSLVIDMRDSSSTPGDAVDRIDFATLDLIVRRATDTEAEAHAQVLAGLDKASGGKTVWTAPTAQESSATADPANKA
ncbi:DNA polymerase III subunit epsilon [Imbroritus primus]|uniref:DNA polymerase III subunit epsilon n=1 Tax=Imbroritus primus TaxID=3058603 RepID=UPI003D161226